MVFTTNILTRPDTKLVRSSDRSSKLTRVTVNTIKIASYPETWVECSDKPTLEELHKLQKKYSTTGIY